MIIYSFLILFMLRLTNIFVVWLFIEIIFLFFILIVLNSRTKNLGLIIYFFFQSFVSLILFISLFINLDKLILILLIAKLGLFPFFYWMVTVRVKLGLYGNLFVLRLQKLRVFWLLWLTIKSSFVFIYFIVYLNVFFVVLNLLLVVDLWLLLVYSSIANTSIIIISVFGSNYLFVVILYLSVIFFIVIFIMKIDSYIELLLIVFFFLVVPPFLLFLIKFYIIISLEYLLKLRFFLAIFDVLVLLYYFRLVFIKFILIDIRVLIYLINILILVTILLLRNCVALIIFY